MFIKTFSLSLGLICIILLSPSCTNRKKTVSEDTNTDYFIIGQGGGVTGEYLEYKVYENGDVWKMNWEAVKHEPSTQLSAKNTQLVFEFLHEENWSEIDYIKPGNFTYYIAIMGSDRELHRVVWGDLEGPTNRLSTVAVYEQIWAILNP